MDLSAVNSFDALIGALALVAGLMGFVTGLLRSLATIAGWLAAAPVAVWATPLVGGLLGHPAAPADGRVVPVGNAAQTGLGFDLSQAIVFVVVLLVGGLLLSRVLRSAVATFIAPMVSLPDRLAGAMLGAGRIGLVAVVLVLVFDRIIPSHLQPQVLAESRLRPVLSSAGAAGLKTLPPEIEAFIDRLKREHGL